MHSSYTFTTGSAVFDEQNLLSAAGLVPVLELAEQTGLSELINERVDLPSTRVKSGAVNPAGKLTSIVAGMMCGADSIDDANVLRAGGTPRVFNEVYAPSTLGIFLREFTFGHTKQLAAVAREHLIALAARTRCWLAPTSGCFWTSTRCCARSTATPSRAPPSVMPRSPAARCCGWACPHRSPPSPRRPPRR
ncbi:putative tnpC protein [Mycobacterium xenopi 4042]|uniref:Putative tnpC protein n=1 Tax=Mycobacterium xenopi 4042 TaxID=1299334 RepID=X8CMF7_MYCXE|nr:putative tnpC protein [Mycobacterium xenopi 4042]